MQKKLFFSALALFSLSFAPLALCAQTSSPPKTPTDLPTSSLGKRLKRALAGHHYKFFVIHFANAEYGSSFIAYVKLLKAIKIAIEDAPCHCEISEDQKSSSLPSKSA